MNTFGLGIVLSCTDKFSAVVGGAASSFDRLNYAADSATGGLDAMGKTFSSLTSLGAGMTAAITAPIAGFVGKITQYGMGRASFVEDTHLAFTSLMSDAQTASDYMQELMDFAKTTPYTYESIAGSAQTLIAAGIKDTKILNKEANGTFNGILQALGDAAGATGTGVAGFQAMADVISNIKAEGGASAIRIQQLQRYGIQAQRIIGNLYNIDETKALDKIKSLSAEQFISDLSKGIEEGTKGLNGATGKMAGQMSNLKETFTGAKDTFVSSLKTAGLSLMGMYTDKFGVARYKFERDMSKGLLRLSNVVKNLAPMFQPIVNLFDKVVTKGSKALEKLSEKFVELPKPLQGMIGTLVTILALMGPGLLFVAKVCGPLVENIRALGTAFTTLRSPLLKFGLAAGAIYLAWKTNFLGIRTLITNFTTHSRNAFNNAKKIANSNVTSMMDSISNLRSKGDYWSNVTIGLTKLFVIGKAVSELFHSKDGLTMSYETWQKAKELGILPFIEGLLDLKYRFDHFKKGFIEGWRSVNNAIANAFASIGKIFKGTFLESAIDTLGRFFKAITDNDPNSWKAVGNVIGKIAPFFLTLAIAMKILHKAAGPLAAVKSLVPPIFSSKDKGAAASAGSKGGFGSFLASPKSVAKSMASIAIILGGIALIMTALGVIYMNPYLSQFLDKGISVMTRLFTALLPIASVAGVMGAITYGLGKIGDAKSFAKGVANIAILVGGLQLLVTAMGALNSIPGFDKFLSEGGEVLNKLGGALKNLVTPAFIGAIIMTAALGVLPIPMMVYGLANLAILCGGLALIIAAFGALNKIPGLQDFIEGGGDLLASIFRQIGKIVGAVAGGLAEGVSSALPGIATQLAQFGENIKPFLQAFKGVDASGIGSFAVALGKMMLALTGQQLLEFIAGDLDLGKVATQLTTFGTGIKPFFSAMDGVTEDQISKGTSVLKMLSNLSGYQLKSGGLLQKITGELDVARIGDQLKTFAEKITPFLNACTNVPEGSIETGNQLLQMLSHLSGYQLKSGGLLQKLTGEVDLASAGTQLTDFATNMQGFLTTASGTSADAIANGEGMLGVLDTAMTVVKDATTLDLAEYGSELSAFAITSLPFFLTVSKITDFSSADKFFNTVSKAKSLNSVASGGGANLISYGMGLVRFATYWRAFTRNMKGTADTSGIQKMGTALQQFGNKLKTVNSTVKTQMHALVETARTNLNKLKSLFSNAKLTLNHSHIDLPHFTISGKFDAKKNKVPSVSVSWYEKGGIFDNPSLIGVGENGREAVMPLDKNTGWINELANKIGTIINAGRREIPLAFTSAVSSLNNSISNNNDTIGNPVVNTETVPRIVSTTPSVGGSQVINKNKGNTKIDNSVTFESGSIQISVQNASQEEAERLADTIMQKIAWKQRLESIANYEDLDYDSPILDM